MQPPMQITPCTSCWILLSLTNACLWYVTHPFNGCPAIWWPFDPDEPLTFPFRLDGACRSAKSLNTDIFIANIRLFWIILNIAKRDMRKSEWRTPETHLLIYWNWCCLKRLAQWFLCPLFPSQNFCINNRFYDTLEHQSTYNATTTFSDISGTLVWATSFIHLSALLARTQRQKKSVRTLEVYWSCWRGRLQPTTMCRGDKSSQYFCFLFGCVFSNENTG